MSSISSVIYELTGPHTLVRRVEELSTAPLAASQIVAATEFSVISPGTETAAWSGKAPLRPSRVYPRLVGYCNVAEVIAVGSAVDDVRPGDTVITHQSHRSHFRCERSDLLSVARGLDPDMRRRLAATYLFHLGHAALMAGAYAPGKKVAVVGMGALGLATSILASSLQAELLIVSGRVPELPASLAHATKILKSGLGEAELANGHADLVVNTSDLWADYWLSLGLARAHGTVVLLGFPGRDQAPPPFNPLDSRFLYDRQLTIRQGGKLPRAADEAPHEALRRNMEYLSGLIQRGTIDAAPLVVWREPWGELAGIYQALCARTAPASTAVLEWR